QSQRSPFRMSALVTRRHSGLVAACLLLPPPTLSEHRHCCLARRFVAVRRSAFERVETVGPQPGRADRRGVRFHDAAHHDAVDEPVVVLLVPFARLARSRSTPPSASSAWLTARTQ